MRTIKKDELDSVATSVALRRPDGGGGYDGFVERVNRWGVYPQAMALLEAGEALFRIAEGFPPVFYAKRRYSLATFWCNGDSIPLHYTQWRRKESVGTLAIELLSMVYAATGGSNREAYDQIVTVYNKVASFEQRYYRYHDKLWDEARQIVDHQRASIIAAYHDSRRLYYLIDDCTSMFTSAQFLPSLVLHSLNAHLLANKDADTGELLQQWGVFVQDTMPRLLQLVTDLYKSAGRGMQGNWPHSILWVMYTLGATPRVVRRVIRTAIDTTRAIYAVCRDAYRSNGD